MKKIILSAIILLAAAHAYAALGPDPLGRFSAKPTTAATKAPVPANTVVPVKSDPTPVIPTPDPGRLAVPATPVSMATAIIPAPATGTAGTDGTVPVSVTGTATAVITEDSRKPVNVQCDTSATTKIKITWATSADEPLVYNVFRKLGAEKDFAVINSGPLKVTSYVDAAIKTATAYDYKIEAKDNSENSYMSDVKSVSSAGLGLPQKPYTFTTFQNIESVSMKWSMGTKGSFDISGYNLYRGKTPDKIEFYKFFRPDAVKYDDEAVEPAIKYFYRMRTIDVAGYESDPTDIEAVVPFPRPRTGLVLTSTGYRNNIYDNFGLNADFLFTYYIGSIFSDYNGESKTLNPVSVMLFTGDIKGTVFNEFETWPSLALGFSGTILMQYNLGGSDATGGGAVITAKTPVNYTYGLYLAASKKIVWDTTLHMGLMSGFGTKAQTDFMAYLSGYLDPDPEKGNIKASNFAYYFGFGRPLFGKMELKVEVIVPIEANKNALFPNYYLINTHVENFLRFDFAYMHFPGGSEFLGFINFRFSVYPNPYK